MPEAYLVHGTARAILLWVLVPVCGVAFFMICVMIGRDLMLRMLGKNDSDHRA